MKPAFFSRLAVEGMKKNRKIYLPYILSCVGMVTMFYILMSLSASPAIKGMVHGGDIAWILSLGKFVIAVFALLFLFYTNSFLIKRRYKEYGLYSILGMNKRNIARIVLWESVITSFIGIAGGIACGIVLSKLAELGLLNMARQDITYDWYLDMTSVRYTAEIFAVIFALLTAKTMIRVGRCRPVELMQAEHEGEKPVKANWITAILGVLFLGAAYYEAVTIDNPLTAITLFFVAVIMVIIGTYLLFISGSVALCRLLQKKKSYYYRRNHFVAVSSMTYRMKRNGAGLASICILVTMVLVMISSTGSLYFGADDAMRTRYPKDVEFTVEMQGIDGLGEEKVAPIRKVYDDVFADAGYTPADIVAFRYAAVSGMLEKDHITLEPDYDNILIDYNRVRAVYIMDVNDYNRLMGTDVSVIPGEAYLYTLRCGYGHDTITAGDMSLRIAGRLDSFPVISEAQSLVTPSLMLVVPGFDTVKALDVESADGGRLLQTSFYCGYDSGADEETTLEMYRRQREALLAYYNGSIPGYSCGCLFEERADFYTAFGGMFFLGIILSIVFTFAAAVIIYYKQVTEGYEDRKRFGIMRKVGMTDRDIRQTVDTQVLTVFFAPLVAAGIHLCFAFPFIWKILMLFNLRNLGYVILITVIAYVLFGAFYALIYRSTSRNYFMIVSREETDPA